MRSADLPIFVVRAEDFRHKSTDYHHPSKFQPLTSKIIDVQLIGAQGHRKLFKILFRKQSNGLDITVLPSVREPIFGRAGNYSIDVPPGSEQTLSIAEHNTKTTTKVVKLSHHADGRAHFSQDGQVFTEIIGQSTPVSDLCGHFFTFQFWGLGSLRDSRETNLGPEKQQRSSAYFAIDDDLDPTTVAARISGYCYSRCRLSVRSLGSQVNDPRLPTLGLYEANRGRPTLALAPVDPSPDHDVVVVLSYAAMLSEDNQTRPTLYLSGGYESPSTRSTKPNALDFIGIAYSDRSDDWDALVASLGSIDFRPDAPPHL